MKPLLALAPLLLVLTACDPGKDGDAVDKEVVRFHQAFDESRYDQIYDEAAPVFQQTKPKADLIHFIDVVHQKLGAVKSSSRSGWRDNVNTDGHTYVTAYATVFEKGSGTETFTYLIVDGRPKLVGYNINSDALVLQ